MTKALIVGSDYSVSEMFKKWGWESYTSYKMPEGYQPDFLMFTGGADISPHLYGEENIASWPNEARDAYEIEVYNEFPDAKKLGICRGMQLLNVLNGGKMNQNISGHGGGRHLITDLRSGDRLKVNSCHHQCVIPPEGNNNFEVIAMSDDNIIEALMIHSDNALGIQGHPEWETPTEEYFRSLITRYFGV